MGLIPIHPESFHVSPPISEKVAEISERKKNEKRSLLYHKCPYLAHYESKGNSSWVQKAET